MRLAHETSPCPNRPSSKVERGNSGQSIQKLASFPGSSRGERARYTLFAHAREFTE